MNIRNIDSNVKYIEINADNDYSNTDNDKNYIKDAGMIDETNITIVSDKDNSLAEIKRQKAFFVVDKDNNVLIKLVDPDGNHKQILPEEYVPMNDGEINLFHVEV